MVVIRYQPKHRGEASAALADAFFDDPVVRWLVPDPEEAKRTLPKSFGSFLWCFDKAHNMNEVVVDDDTGNVIGAALWEPAVMTWFSLVLAMLVAVYHLVRITGPRRFIKMGKLFMRLEGLRNQHMPYDHHHLQMIGTEAGHQGKGHGSALIQVGLARADALGIPTYLESSNPRNIGFYQKNGFEILEEVTADANDEDSPTITLMGRPCKKEQ
eukprot:TRINITY_DN19459_c0_g1_i1.p1 TRINITY_DN19459_c0_g1~~TRINITY_DN19459_c0_g1_i1.p1  ORF type:complete len:213 (+),score=56.99 TRINITY_DN19459_c0_g1_i1:242-880(+)